MSEYIDNRTRRIGALKEIVKQLHQGAAPETVRAQLATIVRETDASEIAAMEQQLIREGTRVEEIQSMCDLHHAVVRDLTRGDAAVDVPPGHPVDTFRRENEALRRAVGTLRAILAELAMAPGDAPGDDLAARLRAALNDLMDIDKHYQRKEHLLFSCLERHGITGPGTVMWAKDDEVRASLKALAKAAAAAGPTVREIRAAVESLAFTATLAVEGMIDKEEHILLPMSLQTLSAEEWGEIWQQSPRYGWCLVEPREGYAPPQAADTTESTEAAEIGRSGEIALPTGTLTIEQLLGIFSTLPVDLTFVDADDRVRFFSEGPDRVFPRSKAILGRKVQNCHPPKSVHVVEQILSDFRAGRQSVAEFWIRMHGKFVHIRYFAVRSAKGEYLGTLEVTQELTHVRSLQGERRLLEYAASAGP
ncbi:MAG: DUF438 domain-containing protein [Phycisphaerae bacterium]